MNCSPLAVKRNYVLGEIYKQCDAIERVPVFMNDSSGELLGYADESLGQYADAFVFHLPEIICRQLSTSHFDYAFGFEYVVKKEEFINRKRIKLNHILLIGKVSPISKKLPKAELCSENSVK